MKGRDLGGSDAGAAVDAALAGDTRKRRHGGRVVLSLDVEPEVRDALRERAAAAGVSMAEYLAAAVAQPARTYDTSAVEMAQPLTQVSYRIAASLDALRAGDVDRVRELLTEARAVVATALRPLAQQHDREVRERDPRRAGGWSRR